MLTQFCLGVLLELPAQPVWLAAITELALYAAAGPSRCGAWGPEWM